MLTSAVPSLLKFEPKNKASFKPKIDSFTKKMVAALRRAEQGMVYRGAETTRGISVCSCGVHTGMQDLYIMIKGVKYLIDASCVHKLAFHRDEVTKEDLALIRKLDYGQEDPTEEELARPKTQTKTSSIGPWGNMRK